MSAPRRREPWPYDSLWTINGQQHGLMFGRSKKGAELVSRQPPNQSDVTPTKHGYSADNPVFGKFSEYGPMPLGMGLAKQRHDDVTEDGQYDHALGVDASVFPWVLGPDITILTPTTTDSTNGVTGFMRVGNDYNAIVGRYALVRVSDLAWAVAADFGVGKAAVDQVAFYSNALSAPMGFVAMGDAEHFWQVTTSTWAQHASLFASSFGVAAREIFRSHSVNALTKCDIDADPRVAGNWGNEFAFDVGDQSSPIVRLPTTAAGVLLVVKTDGVYTIQGVNDPAPGYDQKLHEFVPDALNGRAVGRWGNELYVGSTYSGFWRFNEDASGKEQCGPEMLTDGSSVVTGYVTACHETQFALYAGFYNPSSGLSYLCKFLGLTEVAGKKVPVWHGSLSQAYTAQITALDTDVAGAASGHARLYLGFGNGQIGWFTLPCTAHPKDCEHYTFSTTDSTITLPRWHGGFPANLKDLGYVASNIPNAGAAVAVDYAYRADPAAGYTALGTAFTTAPQQQVAFEPSAAAVNLDQVVTLTTVSNTVSPHVEGIGLNHRLHTEVRQVFAVNVLAQNGLVNKLGVPLRLGQREIHDLLRAAASPDASPGSVTIVLPDEESRRFGIIWDGETTALDDRTGQVGSAVRMQLVELALVNQYGLYSSLEAAPTYGVLSAYSYSELARL